MDLEILRHSCAHIMAAAVKQLYPDAKFGIGPAIEDGFYYDIDAEIKEEDLPRIEKVMKKIVSRNEPFVREEWDKDKAGQFFSQKEEKYKLELIRDIPDNKVTVYRTGEFIDLCRGPHVHSAGEIKHFKLLTVSGAYWKGDEHNPQLTRIYGTAFASAEELKQYLENREEAKKRDHRILGKTLDLFDIYHNEAGAGLVFYLPKGAVLRRLIEDWEINEHTRRGYDMVVSPHIMHRDLWQKSGHLDHYQEFMYPVKKDNQEFILKPMNCPGHMLVYRSKLRSWRDLPLRIFELGTVYRYEKSGVLCGLLRVRGFTQDDAHIFCREEDLYPELEGVLDFVKDALHTFGFEDFEAELSTRPEEFIGEREMWDKAEDILEKVLKKSGIPYQINEGDGAFYGPKIDIKLRDALKRSWQCATVQLDYSLPERFDLNYHDKDGEKKRVVMLHRVILGSLERFIATLVEHYAGKFPVWLAPVQVSVVSITDEVIDYARTVKDVLVSRGFRAELDVREERLQKKIREHELQKIPYIVIIGKKEKENKLLSLRERGGKDLGQMSLDEFAELLTEKKEVRN